MLTKNSETRNVKRKTEVRELLSYIADYLPDVAAMVRPLDEKQAGQLIKRYGYDAVKSQFENIENKMKPGQYKSAFLTCMKWFEMDIKKGYFTPPETQNPKHEAQNPQQMVNEFLSKHPVGSEIKFESGTVLKVEDALYLRNKLTNKVITITDFIKYQRRS